MSQSMVKTNKKKETLEERMARIQAQIRTLEAQGKREKKARSVRILACAMASALQFSTGQQRMAVIEAAQQYLNHEDRQSFVEICKEWEMEAELATGPQMPKNLPNSSYLRSPFKNGDTDAAESASCEKVTEQQLPMEVIKEAETKTSSTEGIIEMHTDGSCLGNPGRGGWACIICLPDGQEQQLGGGVSLTTNNRMEILAVLSGLRYLDDGASVRLYTDSEYVCKGIGQWLPKWKAKRWRTSGKDAVKNVDLWKEMDELLARHKVQCVWVRGHDGNEMNERCDKIAKSHARQGPHLEDAGYLETIAETK